MFIIRWIADLLGILMNGIYYLLNAIGIPNVGIAIILFTIVIYLLMTPLQIKQQRFSRMNAVMMPEIKKIQEKYKNKKDQLSMQKQNEEVQAVYQKYGVSASGSCVQLLIQMPVLFALYQVIYRIPGYITLIKDQLSVVAESAGFPEFMTKFVTTLDNAAVTRNFGDGSTNKIIDTLYSLNTNQWNALLGDSGAETFSSVLSNAHSYVSRVTSFLGLYISDSPSTILTGAWKDKAWGLIFASVIIPVLAYVTQVLNTKLMTQGNNNKSKSGEMDQAEATMRSMNTVMPIMSAVFCFTLPVGIGIYWIAGAVVRSVQQVVINKQLEKEDLDEIIRVNQEKAAKKREKNGLPPQKITQEANRSVRNLEIDRKMNEVNSRDTVEERGTLRADSIAAKANLVKMYDEKNRRK